MDSNVTKGYDPDGSPCYYDDEGNELIIGVDICEHGVVSETGCDDCYDARPDKNGHYI